ncbi:MAG: hypothetical protein B6D63_07305, partial [Candidatus Latescibacteria bacterium 4484_7]
PQTIKALKESFKLDARTTALLNAVTNNNTKDLAFNRLMFNKYNDIFNYKIKTKGITNQKQSGRCWLFAGLNIMRPAVMKKFNLDKFEFSENYLFFWDKLEKANMFLEAIIETKNKPFDDRELSLLVENPVPDGGWWEYVVDLMDKYGAVPKSAMPETKNSSNTRAMNALINKIARHDAIVLRDMAKRGKSATQLRKKKLEMLKTIYRVLALHLGVPPEQFTWRCEDKDGKIVEGTYTPVSFYKEAVGVKLSDYLPIIDHPIHPYGKHYRIKYSRNMSDVPDIDFVNLKIDRLKEFALKSLLAGEPVWFAADVGKENDYKEGIMAVGIYDYQSLFGIDASLSKADRVRLRDSTPNHAMVFIGVDTLGGKPLKWLVENSWGTDRGNKGYWTMYDNWFDEYVFAVIINKAYLPDDVTALFKTKPITLPAWDPMRDMYR